MPVLSSGILKLGRAESADIQKDLSEYTFQN